MPDVDGGHGFLTALLPLNTAPCLRTDGAVTSPAHAVRELLASLPTAQHSAVFAASGLQSPFARSRTTHFARFAVIDAPAFNGSVRQDAVRASLPGGVDPLAEPAVDRLPRPYLMVFADFDIPPPERGAPDPQRSLRLYLEGLWPETCELWSAVLAHCDAAGEVRTPQGFAAYVLERRVETTQPFNDYAVVGAAAGGPPAILVPLALAVAAGVAAAVGVRAVIGSGAVGWTLALVLGAAVSVAVGVLAVVRWGRRSAPWGGGTDLATVLKALHLQAAFARFAIDHQGASAADLHHDFCAFVRTMRPTDLDAPTQAPGVVPR